MAVACSFLIKAFLIKVYKRTRLSVIPLLFGNPHGTLLIRPFVSRYQFNILLIILSKVLQIQLNAVGQKFWGADFPLLGFGMGIRIACFQI